MSAAPVAMGVVLVFGMVGGAYLASVFYGERFAVMEERVKSAEERAKAAPEQPSVSVSEPLISGYGSGSGKRCNAQLNTRRFLSQANDYLFVLVCGVSRPNLDRALDTAVTISAPRTIEREATVSVETSAAMLASLEALAKTTPRPPMPPGSKPQLNFMMWHEVVLIPRGANLTEAHSIAELVKLGGLRYASEARSAAVSMPIS